MGTEATAPSNRRATTSLINHIAELGNDGKWESNFDLMHLPDAGFEHEVKVYCSNFRWHNLTEKLGSELKLVDLCKRLLKEVEDPSHHYSRYDDDGAERYVLYETLNYSNDVWAVVIVYLGIAGKGRLGEILIL